MGDCPQPSFLKASEDTLSAASAIQRILDANVCAKNMQYSIHAAGEGEVSLTEGTGTGRIEEKHDAIASEKGCGAITASITAYNEAKYQISCIMTKVSQSSSSSTTMSNKVTITVINDDVFYNRMQQCGGGIPDPGKIGQTIDGRTLSATSFTSDVMDQIHEVIKTAITKTVSETATDESGAFAWPSNAVGATSVDQLVNHIQGTIVSNQLVQSVVDTFFAENSIKLTFTNYAGPIPTIDQSLMISTASTKILDGAFSAIAESMDLSKFHTGIVASTYNAPGGVEDLLDALSEGLVKFVLPVLIGIGVGGLLGGFIGYKIKVHILSQTIFLVLMVLSGITMITFGILGLLDTKTNGLVWPISLLTLGIILTIVSLSVLYSRYRRYKITKDLKQVSPPNSSNLPYVAPPPNSSDTQYVAPPLQSP